MRRMGSKGAALGVVAGLLLGTVGAAPAVGQEATGVVGGVVTHRASGPAAVEPVGGTAVRLHEPDGTEVAATVTDSEGRYTLAAPPGAYTVVFSAPGHREGTVGGVQLADTTPVEVPMRLDPVALPAPFADVSSPVADWTYATGIVRGYADRTFRPRGPLTRAQAVTSLWRFADEPAAPPQRRFGDVRRQAWYARALDWVVATGAANSFASRPFEPARAVTANQWPAMVAATLGRPSACPIPVMGGGGRLAAMSVLYDVAGSPSCWTRWRPPLPHTIRFGERATVGLVDSFDRTDRPVDGDRSPTDHIWRSYGYLQGEDPSNRGVIVGGSVATPHAGASSNWVELDTPPDEVSMSFTIAAGATTTDGGASGLIVSPRRAPDTGIVIAQHSVHVAVSSTATLISLYDGQYHDPAYQRTFAEPLVGDGQTAHRVTVRRIGEDTLRVTNPDGSVGIFADPLVSDLWGPSVLVEPYRPAATWLTDREHRIADVVARTYD
jgi:hypothetical protein